jgi:hypothetical protein
MRSYYDSEDYQFPLPVQDMNNEIISRLDDESLYRLCQTNKQMAKTCLSNNIWTMRANSPLAPLYIVRDQYKNLMDFYANVRKDYLYRLRSDVYSAVFTSIKVAFYRLLRMIEYPHATRLMTPEQLESAAANTSLTTGMNKYGDITLVRKNVVFDDENLRENTLYGVGRGDKDFLNPNVLSFPDMIDVPVMTLVLRPIPLKKSRRMCVNFNEQTLASLILMPDARHSFTLSYNNKHTPVIPISSLGWTIGSGLLLIVSGDALAAEGIDINKNYIVTLPKEVNHDGKTYNTALLTSGRAADVPEGIGDLRWYIAAFGTFYNFGDISPFLPKEDVMFT